MKRIFSIISAGLMLLLASSCVKDNLVVFNPSTATAPVLGTYEIGAKKVTANYTPGSFKMGFNEKVPVNHTIALVSAGGKAVSKVLASGSDGKVSVTNATISKALTSLGYKYDETVAIDLAIRASLQDPTKDNGINGFVDSKELIKIAAFLVEEPAANPFEGFDKESPWGVTGALSAYGISWDKDLEMKTDGTWHVAKSVTLTPEDQFKFRKDGGWDVNIGAAGDVEPFIVSLDDELSGVQGGKNLAVGTDGAYDLWVNGETGAFKVTEAYNPYPEFNEASTWGVTGALSSYGIEWNGDIAMLTDGNGSHLAQGVRITKADQFKLRKDQAWDDNYGAPGDTEPFLVDLDVAFEAAAGGKNLGVHDDGVYDIILNVEAKTITICETLGGPESKKIGGDEPEPEPPTFEGWSIIGTVNGGTEWNTDYDMEEISDGIFYINGVSVSATSEFKIRKDHDWATSYGVAGEAKVEIDKAFAATTDNGSNIKLGSDAKVDITLDTNDNTIILATHQALYSLIGNVEGKAWDKDFFMSQREDGKWIVKDIQIDGEFKVRYDASWDDDKCYGVAEGQEYGIGKEFELSQPGANIKVDAGKYNVTFDPATKNLLIENAKPSWSLIGVNGDWNTDIVMTEIMDGIWASPATAINGEFKIRFNADWAVNRGGGALAKNGLVIAVQDGANINVADGTYIIIYDANDELIYAQGWSVIGAFGEHNWDFDLPMIPTIGGQMWVSYIFEAKEGSEVKARFNADWGVNRGGEFADFTTPFAVAQDGANIKLPADGYYFIVYSAATEQMSVGRADWSIIGGFNGWSGDVVMLENDKGVYEADVTFAEDTEFKLRKDRDWAVNRGGEMAAYDEAFEVKQEGSNIKAAAGTYHIVYDSNKETVTVKKPSE